MFNKQELLQIHDVCKMAAQGFDALKAFGVDAPDDVHVIVRQLKGKAMRLAKELEVAEQKAAKGEQPELKLEKAE